MSDLDNIKKKYEEKRKEKEKIVQMYKEAIDKHLKKTKAATLISERYKEKLSKDEINIKIGNYLCNNLTKKDLYREKLYNLIKDNDFKISNIYLLYCLLGSKFLGIDKNSKTEKLKHVIKEINNSVFINVGFLSTNLEGIIFNNVRFISDNNRIIGNYLLKTNKTLKTKYNKSQQLMFNDKTNLNNCIFNDCLFYRLRLNDLNGFIFSKDESYKYPGYYFGNCKFSKCNLRLIIKSSYNKDYIKDKKYFIVSEPLTKILDSEEKERWLESNSEPANIIFENCTFNGSNFLPIVKTNVLLNKYLFIGCKFIGSTHDDELFLNTLPGHNYLVLSKCEFRNCSFELMTIKNIIFKNTSFKGCSFSKVSFKSAIFASNLYNHVLYNIVSNVMLSEKSEVNSMINCSFNQCAFIRTIFSNLGSCISSDSISCTELKSCNMINSSITNSVFQSTDLICFKFNDSDSKIMNLRNNDFYHCKLYGTDFTNCDLYGSKIVVTTVDNNKINWFGNVIYKVANDKIKNIFINNKKYEPNNIILNVNTFSLKVILRTQLHSTADPHFGIVNYSTYQELRRVRPHEMRNKNVKKYLLDIVKVKYFDFLPITRSDGHTDYYYMLPETNFTNANLKNVSFAGTDGFEEFDFSIISKDDSGRPDLRSTNFTGVELINAKMNNANIIGTIFQASNVLGLNFENTIYNENTDFENVMNFVDAVNTDHIHIGDLQNRANETHSRAKHIIKNRNEIIDFFNDNSPNSYYDTIIAKINDPNISRETIKTEITLLLSKVSTKYDNIKEYIPNIQKIVTDEFINILLSEKSPLPNDVNKNNWTWKKFLLASLNFISNKGKDYTTIFFNFYFDEIFNAHGRNSQSCTLGMVERFVTIHSQAAEIYIINHLDSSEKINEKYKFNKLINLIKPKSDLPESKDEDTGIQFDYNIPPNEREEWHNKIKSEFTKGEIKNMQELSDDFTNYFIDKIIFLNTNKTKKQLLDSLSASSSDGNNNNNEKKLQIINDKINILKEHLINVEVPLLKTAILGLALKEETDIITEEDIIDYFSGGKKYNLRRSKLNKTSKKGSFISRAKSFPLKGTVKSSIRKVKFYNLEDKNSIEEQLINKYINLSKNDYKKLSNEEVIEKISLKNMNITDKPYIAFMKNLYNKILEKKEANNKFNKKINECINKSKTNSRTSIFKKSKKSKEPKKSRTMKIISVDDLDKKSTNSKKSISVKKSIN